MRATQILHPRVTGPLCSAAKIASGPSSGGGRGEIVMYDRRRLPAWQASTPGAGHGLARAWQATASGYWLGSHRMPCSALRAFMQTVPSSVRDAARARWRQAKS